MLLVTWNHVTGMKTSAAAIIVVSRSIIVSGNIAVIFHISHFSVIMEIGWTVVG